jgi:hypothetical protein
MTRKQANMEILRMMANYINSNPDLRFGQALRALDITRYEEVLSGKIPKSTPFYEESTETLNRVIKALKDNL